MADFGDVLAVRLVCSCDSSVRADCNIPRVAALCHVPFTVLLRSYKDKAALIIGGCLASRSPVLLIVSSDSRVSLDDVHVLHHDVLLAFASNLVP